MMRFKKATKSTCNSSNSSQTKIKNTKLISSNMRLKSENSKRKYSFIKENYRKKEFISISKRPTLSEI